VGTPTPYLAVNEDEAARVRAIFALYLEHEPLLPLMLGFGRGCSGAIHLRAQAGVPSAQRSDTPE
jgi:hypothetical protein